MAMKLIIGLGGTGSRVVEQIAERIRENGGKSGNDETTCIIIDADPNEDSGDEDGLRRFLTCTPLRVRDCVERYAKFRPEEWLPKDPALMAESMMDGANSRAKARLSFLNFMKSGQSAGLIDCIDRLVYENQSGAFHVEVVTSLCGNFGSGVVLQTALWIRRLFAERGITNVDFTGFFLLPDLFIRNIPSLLGNSRTRIYLQANAYASLRELNAAFQVRRNGLQTESPFVIDDLFDASREGGAVRGIYDYVYLIGDANRNGIAYNSLAEFETMLADGIFARNYHPMASAFFSTEMHGYAPMLGTSEARYLSMGSAKAVYPTEEIREYCILRGIRETVLRPWLVLEPMMEEGRRLAEESGTLATEGELFLRAFGDLSTREDPVRGAAFAEEVFLDTVNEKYLGDITEYTDKIADFLAMLDERIDAALSGIQDPSLPGLAEIPADGLTREALLDLCKRDRDALRRSLDEFEAEVDAMTCRILRQIMPSDPEEVNPQDPRTVYGCLSKTNQAGKTYAVHPLAARGVLYYLIRALKDLWEKSSSGDLREQIFSYDPTDGSATLGAWEPGCDPVEVLTRRKTPLFGQKRGLREFAACYPVHVKDRTERILRYRETELRRRVCEALLPPLDALSASYEKAFREILSIDDALAGRLAENAAAEDRASGNTLRVYATEGAKVKIFGELNFASWEDHSDLNEAVLRACYVAAFREAALDRSRFRAEFLDGAYRDFDEKIDSDPNRRAAIYLDVFTALRKQADLASLAGNAGGDEAARNERYCDELRGYRDRLTAFAAPFLTTEEPSEKPGLSGIATYLSWCLPKDASQCYPEVDAVLGKGIGPDGGPENELICYRSAGGFEAKEIPGFNEFREESYYLSYRILLDHDPECGVHLDRSWHRFLPYLTQDGVPDGN